MVAGWKGEDKKKKGEDKRWEKKRKEGDKMKGK